MINWFLMSWDRFDTRGDYKEDSLQFEIDPPSSQMYDVKSVGTAKIDAQNISNIIPTPPMAISNRKSSLHLNPDHPPGFPNKALSKSLVDKRITLYKTEICRTFEETGSCKYGAKCQFAHALDELRPAPKHPRYKTEVCKTFWEKGTCPYGKRCCFIHNESLSDGRSLSTSLSLVIDGANHNGLSLSLSREAFQVSESPARESRLLSRIDKHSPVDNISKSWHTPSMYGDVDSNNIRHQEHSRKPFSPWLHGDDEGPDQHHLSQDILRLVDE